MLTKPVIAYIINARGGKESGEKELCHCICTVEPTENLVNFHAAMEHDSIPITGVNLPEGPVVYIAPEEIVAFKQEESMRVLARESYPRYLPIISQKVVGSKVQITVKVSDNPTDEITYVFQTVQVS